MNQYRGAGWVALLSGALAALGHAPFNLWPLALLGFAGLAWTVSGARRPWLAGWLGGVGYFATALHWIVQPFLVDIARHGWMAPFALVFLAAGLALFWGAAGWVAGRTRLPALGWALALSLAELARGYVLTGFPWALPAYIWTETPVRLTAAAVGPFGLTALTLVLTALPFAATRGWMAATGSAALLAVLPVWGLTEQNKVAASDLGTVRLVQPNAPQHQKWDPMLARVFVDRAIEFTAAPKTEFPPSLIVWPETAIPYVLDQAGPVLTLAAEAGEGIPVLTGLNRREGEDWFNSSVLIDGQGRVLATYDKVHLAPFGEYIPFKIDFIRALAASTGYGFTPGAAVHLIDTPLGRALPLICYEAVFPQQIHAAPERPDYLLQITNDAWFGTFSGPYQHLQQARFRAAEQGLPMIRVANTGISAVIDANGRLVRSLPLGEAGYLDVTLPGAKDPTFYSRTGDIPVALFLALALLALIWGGMRNAIALRGTSA